MTFDKPFSEQAYENLSVGANGCCLRIFVLQRLSHGALRGFELHQSGATLHKLDHRRDEHSGCGFSRRIK
jgi:hypothetical protein